MDSDGPSNVASAGSQRSALPLILPGITGAWGLPVGKAKTTTRKDGRGDSAATAIPPVPVPVDGCTSVDGDGDAVARGVRLLRGVHSRASVGAITRRIAEGVAAVQAAAAAAPVVVVAGEGGHSYPSVFRGEGGGEGGRESAIDSSSTVHNSSGGGGGGDTDGWGVSVDVLGRGEFNTTTSRYNHCGGVADSAPSPRIVVHVTPRSASDVNTLPYLHLNPST